MLSMLPLLSLSATLPAAMAADATSIAPFLRGDVVVDYRFSAENARLLENDTLVGTRQTQEGLLTLGGNFSVAPGAALFFDLPYYSGSKISFADTTDMAIDPNTDSGTMLDTETLDPQPEVYGKGLGGVWLGLRGTPMSEDLFARRGDKVTVMLEAAYRFADKTSFWTTTDGVRGAGPGSAAFKLGAAFSTTIGWNEPYVSLSMVRSVPLRDIEGTELQADQIIQTASSFDLLAGTEMVAVQRDASGVRFAIDVHSRFGVQSWQDIPSGVLLPSVLDASSTLTATEGEHSYVNGGLALKYRIFEWVQLDVGGDVGVVMPHQVEHFYPVETGMGTLTYAIGTRLTLRGRDKPQRFPWTPAEG